MATTVSIGTGSAGNGTATLTLSIDINSTNLGVPRYTPPVISNANSPCHMQYVNLSSGDNTIAIPTTAGAVYIVPPTSNAQTLTVRTVSGDTGIPVNAAAPIGPIAFRSSPPSNLYINAGGTVNGVQVFFL